MLVAVVLRLLSVLGSYFYLSFDKEKVDRELLLVLFRQLAFAQGDKDSQTPLQDTIPSQVCDTPSSDISHQLQVVDNGPMTV